MHFYELSMKINKPIEQCCIHYPCTGAKSFARKTLIVLCILPITIIMTRTRL
ncbi:hypothetical protein HMPREF0860_1264 [Treponema socranskii subsp. socranskii VPI DR56BR1116 = ATCC 35536]|uniref:Uncharacterized protein n=1 Tax=Treponema socranskii subsp. socranskii VPI DR56BR1116 = ATCC 35536 TaxID=1125725 RepID=A0ABN0P7Y0_TRESO|nr:hypothetical protein HMPREF0860_1264 [Treponema socranskii subsp. socranskii VPI DR56BR1116 = ATCC 35536]